MKLRNKKTGDVLETWRIIENAFSEIVISKPNEREIYEEYHYDSFNDFCSEWEDYTPKEPLIDFIDERKLVKLWAKVHNIEEVWASNVGNNKEFIQLHDVEKVNLKLTIYSYKKIEIGRNYTIDELCGEEEE